MTANPLQAHYEAKYAAGVELERTSKQYTLACVPTDGALSILDVGCGAGRNSKAMAAHGHTMTGVDLSEHAIARYRDAGYDGRVMDLQQRFELEDETFDLAFCSEVIEHVTDPSHLAAEMFRVVRPGGRLVLSTPNSAFWLYRLFGLFGRTVSDIQHPQHLQFFSQRSLLRVLRDAGFVIDRALGRNMYAIAPDLAPLRPLYRLTGFREEVRYRTKNSFWHLSHRTGFWTTLWADTLIVEAHRPSA